jgi:hypothetical protein
MSREWNEAERLYFTYISSNPNIVRLLESPRPQIKLLNESPDAIALSEHLGKMSLRRLSNAEILEKKNITRKVSL